jgi:hypothetical protein
MKLRPRTSSPATLAPTAAPRRPSFFTPPELLHREIRKPQRDRSERHEAIRMSQNSAALVLDLDHLGDHVALGPIPRRVDAERPMSMPRVHRGCGGDQPG